MGAILTFDGLDRRKPPLNTSIATMTVVAIQRAQFKAAKAASARAAPQTDPRQNRSRPRNTARAMNPAKKKRTLSISMAKLAYGWEALGANLGVISRYAIDRKLKSPTKIKKLI